MNIVPTSIQQHINRIDRQRSLAIGISCGIVAFWSIYRVIWSLYLTMTYSFLFGSLVFQIVLWGVIGAAAAIAATGFLTHYAKTPAIDTRDRTPDATDGKTI
jgi:inner membrane protein involved in colicin E2 resistance